jgi:uncharacterized 2Fe-2S/4Fe-4S cluster protein (DUF4445 family)
LAAPENTVVEYVTVMRIRLRTGEDVPCEEGRTLLEALALADVHLVASCGGKGTCGKCRVRVLEGDAGAGTSGKLTASEREQGFVLACRSRPRGDLSIEIPETSRLVVGDQIAVARASDLAELFASFGTPIQPLVRTLDLHLPPPTLHDNISDLERLRRALEEHDLSGVRFSHGFAESMAAGLRKTDWRVTLGYTQTPGGPEAIYISRHGVCCGYGLAVDIGTTTVVVHLVDLADGRLVDVGSTYNSQMRFGDDVITRIVHATEGGGLADLRKAVVEDINDLLAVMLEKHEVRPEDVKAASVAGNTTMTQLFWNMDPGAIREEPYIPTVNSFPIWTAGTARLAIEPQAPVYTLPCVASYVGGDIVSGVLASRLHRNEEVALFMDIGTNGETAVGNSEWLVTAACSAGPCFEGGGIRYGMRATRGAVEAVSIDLETGEPTVRAVGGAPPLGICGSGMIDAVGEMFLSGVIDQRGKFVREGGNPLLREAENGLEYVLHEEDGRVVSLTEPDLENILRAKAAIFAGVSLLLAEVGLTMDAVERVYIAGGFGNYLDVDKAVILGMLPDIPRERFRFLGNTSVAGAYLTLLSDELRAEAEDIASSMTYIELSVSRGFMDEYMSAMFLPHTNLALFPSVQRLLEESP